MSAHQSNALTNRPGAPGRWAQVIATSPAHRIASGVIGILPGEGVGPEVMAAALDVLDAAGDIEPCALERRFGGKIGFAGGTDDGAVTDGVARFCSDLFHDGGVLFCGPGGGRFVYDLRRRFELFCKLVPLRPIAALAGATPLKPDVFRGADILVVRDNAGGIYQGRWGVRNDPEHGVVAEHQFFYSERQVERIIAAAAGLARERRGQIDVVIKDGGVPTISDLWRRIAERVAAGMGVACRFLNADYAAYALIRQPREFDVLVAPNLLGDMLADLGAIFLGSRGLSFSGNFSKCGRAVYQTGHGAAYDLAGTDRANPLGQILSLAMMLRESYGFDRTAGAIERAIETVLADGYRTDDLLEAGCKRLGTREMGRAIARRVAEGAG